MAAIGIPFLVGGFGKPISQESPIFPKANWLTCYLDLVKNTKNSCILQGTARYSTQQRQ